MINIFNFLFLIPDITKTKNFCDEKNMCDKEVENIGKFSHPKSLEKEGAKII